MATAITRHHGDLRVTTRCGVRNTSRTPTPRASTTARFASQSVRPHERNSLAPEQPRTARWPNGVDRPNPMSTATTVITPRACTTRFFRSTNTPDDREREDGDSEIVAHLLVQVASGPRRRRRSVTGTAEDVREPEQEQLVWRDGVLERSRHRKCRTHARLAERRQGEQLQRTDTEAARDCTHGPSGCREVRARSTRSATAYDRAAERGHPHELRVTQEHDERDRDHDQCGTCGRPAFAHQVDPEERERQPGRGREKRRVHEVQHREAVQRVRDPRYDRART